MQKAGDMILQGADIIDVGGQSTRPGSKRITPDEELPRVLPAIEKILQSFPQAIISVDTYYSGVAEAAVHAGACLINDISGGSFDPRMLTTAASLRVPYICMHMKGTPQTMQQEAVYDDVTQEVLDFFIVKIKECKNAGINDVIIDPGFGFGKSITHNFQLLKDLPVFKMLDRPIMAGLSRKSTVYKTLDVAVEDALNGTTVLQTLALHNGANILRVHDVKEARQTVTLFQKYNNA